jgi:hypothetical protein
MTLHPKSAFMKKLLFCLLFIALAGVARATHLMGGDLVVHHQTANQYELRFTAYRDTLGIPMYTSETIYVYKYNTSTSSYVTFTTMIVPLNTVLSTLLLPSFPYGVEVGVYNASITLPTGKYRFVVNTCCRNGAILNMASPLAESMVLYTDLQTDTMATNSTPGFLAMPVAYFAINDTASYNPLPFDPESDSIAWNLNIPFGSTTAPATNPSFDSVSGFVAPSAAAAGPFTMNPVTGEITWIPNLLGNFVQSFEVDEYKNGVQVGKIIRDMQYVVIPDTGNSSPFFQSLTQVNYNTQQGYKYMYYFPGQVLNFQLAGSQSGSSQLEMDAFGEIFQMANPATFSTSTVSNVITGSLSWTPSLTEYKDRIVVFRLGNGQFTRDYSLVLRKSPWPAGVSAVNTTVASMQVFPNPSNGNITVSLDLDKEMEAELVLYNSLGQQVRSLYRGKLMKGTNKVSEEMNLAAGVFYLVLRSDGQTMNTTSVVIK